MPKKPSSPTPITATRHNDKRANIPTEELRDFVADEEKTPKTILYPRDPSLDPQLVWKGKDEQDRHPLEVPAVPIYIQEKISPQAIIENVRAQALTLPSPAGRGTEQQMALFADFNNITFEDLVDFYHHEQNWTNRLILGDSLLVMTSLAEKEALKGKVQMIYMDPPYGIKFGSNWQVSTRKRDVKDGKEEDLTRQPEQIKAFRDTWELGIHSYLAYLRDRLTVARELLTESGSVFVQIGDENVHLVRCVLDEVFGSENYCRLISYVTTSFQADNVLANVTNYILWYAKSKDSIKIRPMYRSKEIGSDGSGEYKWLMFPDGHSRSMMQEELLGLTGVPSEGRAWRYGPMTSQGWTETGSKDYMFHGKTYSPGLNQHWKTELLKLEKSGRLIERTNSLSYYLFLDDFPVSPITNIWLDTKWGFDASEKMYVVQTNTKIIERCLLMATDPGDLVLDPTCGSGTTAYVAEQWGRRWITIDTSRVAIALARTRLMAGRYPYYLLADSPEGQRKERELDPHPQPFSQEEKEAKEPSPYGRGQGEGDIRRGFVYKRVPHITLKSIANNEEIDVIHEKWQPQLEALREQINTLAGKTWQEWEIPRLPSEYQSEKERAETEKSLKALGILPNSAPWKKIEEWWALRRQRQQEIDASIARHADTELLYDQPYEDNKRVRVTGPFTVESLSPHRVLSTTEDRPQTEQDGQNQSAASGGFETLIIDNLRAAGVENTKKGERLKFTRLEPYAGTWLHAVGEYLEKETSPQPSPKGEGVVRRVAVCIGPEHGTVSPDLIKDAAKEAVQGVGFDLLVVLGFAFDPHVSEEIHRYGKLTVLPARINPDLQMGNLLLKKSGAGNLFMVFGEPDVEVKEQPDGKLTVSIKGVDIYDPTTGEIRSSSTDDIACWFIDTEYNGESFFVRHAYFTGADQPYDKLKRALRAEVDEAAWSALYATTSYPFEKPKSGRIAVKVINHYGDEVLKVYSV
jgi:adenine-specific DNA-methyltransferase